MTLLVCVLCVLSPMELEAQEGFVPTKQSIDKTLSLRLKPRSITYERPAAGSALKINNGATVFLQDGEVKAVIHSEKVATSIKLVPSVPITANIEKQQKPIQPIEMRVLGQSIYMDRQVELLVVQDITGRSIKTLVGGHKLSLDGLRAGVYIVRVQDKGLTHTSKFVLR